MLVAVAAAIILMLRVPEVLVVQAGAETELVYREFHQLLEL